MIIDSGIFRFRWGTDEILIGPPILIRPFQIEHRPLSVEGARWILNTLMIASDLRGLRASVVYWDLFRRLAYVPDRDLVRLTVSALEDGSLAAAAILLEREGGGGQGEEAAEADQARNERAELIRSRRPIRASYSSQDDSQPEVDAASAATGADVPTGDGPFIPPSDGRHADPNKPPEPKWPKNCKGQDKLPCKDLQPCIGRLAYRDKHNDPEDTNDKDHGLKNRINEQIYGRCGPGTKVWKDHIEPMDGMQKKLQKFIKEYQKRCQGEGNPPVPKDIEDLSKQDLPTTDKDWKGGDPKKPPPYGCNGELGPWPAPDPDPAAEETAPAQPPAQPDPAAQVVGTEPDEGPSAGEVGAVVAAVAAIVGVVVFSPEILAGIAAVLASEGFEAAVAFALRMLAAAAPELASVDAGGESGVAQGGEAGATASGSDDGAAGDA